ncbi:hypothetical protein D9C73_000147 [Collichthys lucidus]|uniref:Uncharacterized protein n=1 Tax=Collichthys lucidus TaxID=240159 RepID=A0A4U5TYU7_COLLU|nr:hypothetical protein D9C73_000147 [Collichthys lucidus]
MEFKLAEFVANPTPEVLKKCKRADLCLIASSFGVYVSSSAKKEQLYDLLYEKLTERGWIGEPAPTDAVELGRETSAGTGPAIALSHVFALGQAFLRLGPCHTESRPQTSNIVRHRKDAALRGLPVFLWGEPKDLFKQCLKEQTDKIIDVNDDEDDEGDDDAHVDCTVEKGVKGTMVLKVSLVRSFNIEEDMDPNLPGSSSSNSTLPLPGPSTQTTEVWKTAAPSEAVRLFMEDLRRGGDHQPPLRLTLNASDTDEERDGTLISFYKQRRETCQWAADFRCSILGID